MIHQINKGGGGVAPFFNEPQQANQITAGRYYGPGVNYNDIRYITKYADTVIYSPFKTPVTHIFNGIGVYNYGTASNGDNIRLGVYEDDGTGSPGDRLLDTGDITLDSTSALRVKDIYLPLQANTLYWLAFNSDTTRTSSIYGFTPVNHPLANLGIHSLQTKDISVLTQIRAYGSGLPLAANISGIATELPIIYMKG